MKLDFRTKFVMTVVISTLSISGRLQKNYPLLMFFITLIPFFLLLTEGMYKIFLKGLTALILANIANQFILDRYNGVIGTIIMVISFVITKMVPGLMMGYYSVVSTSMCDLIESLKRMRLPDAITIPISVIFRFFYSIREDYGLINEAMKMHGLTMGNFLKDPMRILEYKLIPLLMCSAKSADDVAISAMTRGMVVGQKRSSISNTSLRWLDYIIILLMIFLVFIYLRSIIYA